MDIQSYKKVLFFLLFFLITTSAFSAPSKSYKKIFKSHSKTKTFYQKDNMRALVIFKSTHITDELCAEQKKELRRIYKLSIEESPVCPKDNKSTLFFVSFYADASMLKDLMNKKSDWELTLETGSGLYRPSQIEKMGKPTAINVHLYPTLDQWSNGYYVWFPVNSSSAKMTLSLRSPYAKTDLVWK